MSANKEYERASAAYSTCGTEPASSVAATSPTAGPASRRPSPASSATVTMAKAHAGIR